MKKLTKLEPRDIDKDNWYYVDNPKMIDLWHRVRGLNGYIQTDRIKIPVKMLKKDVLPKGTKN